MLFALCFGFAGSLFYVLSNIANSLERIAKANESAGKLAALIHSQN